MLQHCSMIYFFFFDIKVQKCNIVSKPSKCRIFEYFKNNMQNVVIPPFFITDCADCDWLNFTNKLEVCRWWWWWELTSAGRADGGRVSSARIKSVILAPKVFSFLCADRHVGALPQLVFWNNSPISVESFLVSASICCLKWFVAVTRDSGLFEAALQRFKGVFGSLCAAIELKKK